MTKLEKEIFEETQLNMLSSKDSKVVRSAAEVAKRWIEKAFEAGQSNLRGPSSGPDKETWLKENGIEPQESGTKRFASKAEERRHEYYKNQGLVVSEGKINGEYPEMKTRPFTTETNTPEPII